jgi:hypothetical protein
VFGHADIPLLVRRGGRDIQEKVAKLPLMERTGWSITGYVEVRHSETLPLSDHPVCAAKVASRHDSYWRSHPSSRGECGLIQWFAHFTLHRPLQDHASAGLPTVPACRKGTVKVNWLPRPGSLFTQILPPCCSMSRLVIVKPRPVPSFTPFAVAA